MDMLGVQLVEFYMESIEQRDPQGSPIYVDREFVRITNAGGKDAVEREVKDTDKVTYMAQYKAFKDGVAYEGEGFKLRDTSFLSKSEIQMCLKARVYTVEQLAGIDENGAKALGLNALVLRDKAANWLKGRSSTDTLVNQINSLEQRLNEVEEIKEKAKAFEADNKAKDSVIADLQNKLAAAMNETKKEKK